MQWRFNDGCETAGTHGIRVIANTITHIAWRNGPIASIPGNILATA
jgi:hypothetical protein